MIFSFEFFNFSIKSVLLGLIAIPLSVTKQSTCLPNVVIVVTRFLIIGIRPLIKGEIASLSNAIVEVKKIVEKTQSIHIDGLNCDLEPLSLIFQFAEKSRASIDHMNGESIANEEILLDASNIFSIVELSKITSGFKINIYLVSHLVIILELI